MEQPFRVFSVHCLLATAWNNLFIGLSAGSSSAEMNGFGSSASQTFGETGSWNGDSCGAPCNVR